MRCATLLAYALLSKRFSAFGTSRDQRLPTNALNSSSFREPTARRMRGRDYPEAFTTAPPLALKFSDDELDHAVRAVVTPLAPYFLADYFVGAGIAVEARSDVRLRAPAVPLTVANAARVPRHALVYVQVDFTRMFAKELLPHLSAPVIVLTGQHVLPMLHRRDSVVEMLLASPRVSFWLSQNPMLEHRKYGAFPYGVSHSHAADFLKATEHLEASDAAWRRAQQSSPSPATATPAAAAGARGPPRNSSVFVSFMQRAHHPSRRVAPPPHLPNGEQLPLAEFFEAMSRAQYVFSPRGDRPECFRHYESIGLGATPITNLPW